MKGRPRSEHLQMRTAHSRPAAASEDALLLDLVFATVWRASQRRQGVKMSELECQQLKVDSMLLLRPDTHCLPISSAGAQVAVRLRCVSSSGCGRSTPVHYEVLAVTNGHHLLEFGSNLTKMRGLDRTHTTVL